MKCCTWQIGWVVSVGFAVLLAVGGCGTNIPIPTTTVNEVESNNTFSQPQTVTVIASEATDISGSLEGGNDVDVFLLGTFQQGQTLTADLRGSSALISSNVAMGFFDKDQDVAVLDDDPSSSSTDKQISLTVRKAGNYYLVVAQNRASNFMYDVVITIGSGNISTPPMQVVYLNYNGASNLQIGGDQFSNVLPFSAVIPNNTAAWAAQITTLVRADYLNLNIQIISSYESLEPSGPHSVVFVSGSGGSFFGLADDVDWYNQDLTDRAVIFTGGQLHDPSLTQDQFVTGVANVTSHELGHLVGLVHTDDDSELMDQVTPLSQLVRPQTFHLAPLAEFPIGSEDCIQLLQFSLGLL
ncbi:MAG: hypothetical protein WC975_09710 [Phycisphaerae bacterium]